MRRLGRIGALSLGLLALAVGGCRSVYTDADVQDIDRREESREATVERHDEEIGAEGGAARESLEEEDEEVVRDSDL